MKTSIQLRRLLLIFISFTFVTLLIYFTQKPSLYWYLYAIPILVAAFSYHLLGAVVSGSGAILTIILLLYSGISRGTIQKNLTELALELGLGTLFFLLSGIVLGLIWQKQEKKEILLESLSTRDKLTNLYNQSHFTERLQKEIRRAERFGTPLSLIMIDIDHFREFNATFGHIKGDLLLVKLARLIKNAVREIDIAARYGGEEFVVLLPNTGKEAAEVAGRIHKEVSEAKFEGDAMEPLVKKSISLGIATYPSEAHNETELIAQAEEALFRAKSQGRNRICLYSEKVKEEELKYH